MVWPLNPDRRFLREDPMHLCKALTLLLASAGLEGAAQASTLSLQVTDAQGRAMSDAVVFLESADAARIAKPLSGAEMGQRNKTFEPVTLVVTRGTAVDFPNRDTVRHHVYSFSPVKKFELKLYTGTPAKPVVFDQAGIAVLGCNIHDQMVGWVVVVDTPYFARTDSQGVANIKDVPAGSYRLRTWHNSLPVGAPALDQALKMGAESVNVQVGFKK